MLMFVTLILQNEVINIVFENLILVEIYKIRNIRKIPLRVRWSFFIGIINSRVRNSRRRFLRSYFLQFKEFELYWGAVF